MNKSDFDQLFANQFASTLASFVSMLLRDLDHELKSAAAASAAPSKPAAATTAASGAAAASKPAKKNSPLFM
jgi:hypothetical protein